jgi:molecular chaperone GrpE
MEQKEFDNNGQKNTADLSDLAFGTDENAAGTSLLDENVANEDEIEKLKEEIASQKDKYLRLLAEFDNFRRRTAKENLELRQTAAKDVITSLLDVLDDSERAEKQMEKTDDAAQIKHGVKLVFDKLRKTMHSKGVKAMESIGQPFDVEKHEAITEINAPNDKLKGKVLDEVQKGYYLNDKLIRFAKVVVGK